MHAHTQRRITVLEHILAIKQQQIERLRLEKLQITETDIYLKWCLDVVDLEAELEMQRKYLAEYADHQVHDQQDQAQYALMYDQEFAPLLQKCLQHSKNTPLPPSIQQRLQQMHARHQAGDFNTAEIKMEAIKQLYQIYEGYIKPSQ